MYKRKIALKVLKNLLIDSEPIEYTYFFSSEQFKRVCEELLYEDKK